MVGIFRISRDDTFGVNAINLKNIYAYYLTLIKRYPIDGLVTWETSKSVPYREFLSDYGPGKFATLVEAGRYGAPKALVYDGQQRPLRSVLYYTFNDRVLHVDLLFRNVKKQIWTKRDSY